MDYRKERKRNLKNKKVNILLKNLAEVPTLDIGVGRKDAKVSNIEHDQQEDSMEALLNEPEKLDDTIDMKIFEMID